MLIFGRVGLGVGVLIIVVVLFIVLGVVWILVVFVDGCLDVEVMFVCGIGELFGVGCVG